MDHDIYLILLGAGVSLVSSMFTLVFQFVLNQLAEKRRSQHEREFQVRAALTSGVRNIEREGKIIRTLEANSTERKAESEPNTLYSVKEKTGRSVSTPNKSILASLLPQNIILRLLLFGAVSLLIGSCVFFLWILTFFVVLPNI